MQYGMTMMLIVAAEPPLNAPLSLEMRAVPIREPAIVRCARGGIGKTAICRLHVG